MNNPILDFCIETIRRGKNKRYKAKGFSCETEKSLISIALQAKNIPKQHATYPGPPSVFVDIKNEGETAYQRAIYYDDGKHGKQYIRFGDRDVQICWQDIELPITFATDNIGGRNRVDLIGNITNIGSFLCELKYEKSADGNAADYAILEALIYFGIIKRDWALLKPVHRPDKNPVWEKVAQSNTIMVLANDGFWMKAKHKRNAPLIRSLIQSIGEQLGVQVILVATPDYKLRDENSETKHVLEKGEMVEKYKPRLIGYDGIVWRLVDGLCFA